jgi:hypothetical protein
LADVSVFLRFLGEPSPSLTLAAAEVTACSLGRGGTVTRPPVAAVAAVVAPLLEALVLPATPAFSLPLARGVTSSLALTLALALVEETAGLLLVVSFSASLALCTIDVAWWC